MNKIEFIQKMLPICEEVRKPTGIHPKIPIAQAALETGWGISVPDNNLFGMIATPAWIASGKNYRELRTKEYSHLPPEKIQYWNRPGDIYDKVKDKNGGSLLTVIRRFRSYPSWDDSVKDWVSIISGDNRFIQAFDAARSGDLQSFANAISRAGYATDPNYKEKIISIGIHLKDII
jgi:flagellar protein FlgJ